MSGSDQISVGAGADGCIDMLSQAILDPGDRIACGWPSFPSYVIYARKQGAETTLVPLTEHRYDLDALPGAIDAKTKIVYICHPNNPTGTMNTTEELDAYFERVPDHVLTVVDQAYFEYIDRPDYPDAVERTSRPDVEWRCCERSRRSTGSPGCASATRSRPSLRGMAKVRRPFDLTTPRRPPPSRASATGRARAAPCGQRRRTGALQSVLAEHGLEPVPSVGNFVYVETGADAGALYERLLREGIIVRPLAGFGAPTALRISVGTPDELDLFAAALGRVLAGA